MRVGATAALLLVVATGGNAQTPLRPFVPIGVVDDRPGELARAGFEEFRKLRFTVVTTRDLLEKPGDGTRVMRLPPRGQDVGALPAPVSLPGIALIAVAADARGDVIRQRAWVELGRGSRGVLFDGWISLLKNADALDAAAAFADVVTRNAALFAPLTPSSRTVRVDAPPADAFATFLESADAIVLIAANRTDGDKRFTLTFSADTPEAIWQNMETGAAVNFVAGPDGPAYTRAFPPYEVVVLAIRKRYR